MPTRLSVCLLLSAASVSAQEVTATSMPASAPSAMPAASQVVGENVAEEQERLAKKAGVPFDKITPSMAIKLFSEGVFSQEELQWLNTFWAKDAERQAAQNEEIWKKAKKAGVLGNVLFPVGVAASYLGVGGLGFALCGFNSCDPVLEDFLIVTFFGSTLASSALPSLGQKYYPREARLGSVLKYSGYRVLLFSGVAGVTGAMAGFGFDLINGKTRGELIPTLYAVGVSAAGAYVYYLGARKLFAREYNELHTLTPKTASLSAPKSARLQLDIAPMALPTYDGNVSTGLGIVGSW